MRRPPKVPRRPSNIAASGNAPHVTLAAIAGAHGVGGDVRLKLFAEGLDSLKRHKTVRVGARDLTLAAVKGTAAAPVARFAEITDRTAAEALRGQTISVPRSALPPLEDGEYYHADLIGLPCVDLDSASVGTVIGVENFGAGDLLEVEQDGRRALVPFRPGIAELDAGRIRLDPIFLA